MDNTKAPTSFSAAAAASSKGADYRHLIAEARPNVDDVVPDEFALGLASMLSLKGESILAWSGLDRGDFLGDATASNPEAAFLTLNLDVLAEQLERIDLPRRLFVDPDLLPQAPNPVMQNPMPVVEVSEPAKVNTELEKLLDSLGVIDDLDEALPPPPPSSSSSKALHDDFDSWLDTL